MNRYARIAGLVALVLFLSSAAIFGAMQGGESAGFSHWTHPLAWLGAHGVPGALVFNATGFLLPGCLAAFALWPLREGMPEHAPWAARIGAQLVVLSAIAFAAQGVLPLDLDDPEAGGRHAIAWALWLLAFVAGALGFGLSRRPVRPGFHSLTAAIAVAVPVMVFVMPQWLPIAVAQRAAFVLWFVWVVWVIRVPLNRA